MILKLLPILLLSSCALNKPIAPVEVITVTKPAAAYHPPLPSKITTLPLEWAVLTPGTMRQYLDDLEAGNAPTNAYYALTTKGYEHLSANMAEIKRYIQNLLSINEYYRDDEDEVESK